MVPKISLLTVSSDACLLEHEYTAQKFIVAADAVFLKAQGLVMLVPLHETAFGLLKGLLDNWRQLNLTTIKWLCKAEVHQACINIWSLNKQVPWASEFGKTVVLWEHAISTIEQIKLMHFEKMVIELESSVPTVAPQPIVNPAPMPVSTTLSIQRTPSLLSELLLQEQEEVCSAVSGALLLPQECSSRWPAPQNKGKGKAKAMEDDDDDEETAQKLRKELEEFVALTTSILKGIAGCLKAQRFRVGEKVILHYAIVVLPTTWPITVGIQLVSVLAGAVIASQKAACGMATQKKRPPLAALVVVKCIKLVQAAKAFLERQGKPSQFFILEGYKGKGKAKALVEDSETMGTKRSFKSRELVDSDSDKEEEEDRVHAIKKIKHEHVEELTGAKRRKEIMELDDEVEIVAAKIPVAGPSCPASKPIVLVPGASKFVPKPIVTLASSVAGPSTAPIASSSTPKPVAATALSKPAPAKSVGPAVKGGFIFKDSFMVTEVPATQGTLHSDESDDKDAVGDNDDSDNDDGAMNMDSAKQPEETQPVALIKTVTEVKAPASAVAPVLPTKLQRTPFLKLHCTTEHFPYLPLGLQAPIQFKQNRPSVERWQN
ncbi:hypothetical protein C0995_009393 [Termitomyces sp. Mi166|nr:hypothetical protein C0995_009393 [Termitomyces sp. Mi166\